MTKSKILRLLQLRRQIDRKILLNQNWSLKRFFKYKIKVLLATKKIGTLFQFKSENLYHFLNKQVQQKTIQNNHLIDIEPLKIESINTVGKYQDWFDKLKEYNKALMAENALLIVQGSYADGQITNYSDVDLVIFYEPYNKKVLAIKKEIEIFLLQIDPLQHHGIFMIDKTTFDYYWQMDLPVEVLAKAKVFSDDAVTLPITKRINENLSSEQAVWMTLQIIQNFCDKDFNTIGLWRWKFFLSQLMLLPTLLLASKGEYIYKRDSFPKLKNSFSPEAWHCLEKATEIRNNWIHPSSFQVYLESRKDVQGEVKEEAILASSFKELSVLDDKLFYDSLTLLIKETKRILN